MLNGTVKRYGGTAAARFVRRTLLAAAALCAAGQAGAEENLLSNAGFEAGTSGWVRLDPPLFKVVDGQGYGGTKGLVWENDDPRRCLYPRQIAKVKVGHVYRFSGLIKTESLKGKGKVVVCFEWVTKENKWSKGFQAKPVDDNGMLRDGWVRYEGVTPPMPPPAERGAVILYVEGSVGRVRFDDFTLIECEKRIIDGIMSSRVRDEAVDGEVRFAATLNLDVAERPLSSYAVDLSYRDSNGTAKIAKPSTFTEEQAVFKLDVADLAMGAQDLELAVKENAGGRTVAKAAHRFTRLAAPSRRRVSFDARGRMLLDGKVVFPLGMYTGRMSAEDLEIYGKGPFNFATQYGWITRSDLDGYGRIGVYVATDVRAMVYGYSYSAKSRYQTLEQSREAFKAKLAEIGDHPALAMWYLNDEAPLTFVKNVTDIHNLLHEIDPQHATLTCLCHPDTVRNFMRSFDVLAVDTYPIGYRRSKGPEQFQCVWQRQRTSDDGMLSMRPHWYIPQAFNWRWFHSDETVKKNAIPESDMYFPSRREMMNMNWQGIAAGANGILTFSFGTMRKNLKGEEFFRKWEDVLSVANELKKFESVILADPLETAMKPAEKIAARAWRKDGSDWYLIVNLVDLPSKGTVTLPCRAESFKTAVGGGVKPSADGMKLECDLAPLGYALVELNARK